MLILGPGPARSTAATAAILEPDEKAEPPPWPGWSGTAHRLLRTFLEIQRVCEKDYPCTMPLN